MLNISILHKKNMAVSITTKKPVSNEVQQEKEIAVKPKCGLVMPISEINGLLSDHWAEVLGILKDVAEGAGFDTELVSNAEISGIIQQRIVTNLYSNEIVICDVSCKNANVMFELGLRLAFDKATIVIIDDQTDYSFDTSPIQHITYPRDLRHGKILIFKEKLSKMIKATFEASKKPGYSTFLKHFGQLSPQKIKETDLNYNEFVITNLELLSKEVAKLNSRSSNLQNEYLDPRRKIVYTSRPDVVRADRLSNKTSTLLKNEVFAYFTMKKIGFGDLADESIASEFIAEIKHNMTKHTNVNISVKEIFEMAEIVDLI